MKYAADLWPQGCHSHNDTRLLKDKIGLLRLAMMILVSSLSGSDSSI